MRVFLFLHLGGWVLFLAIISYLEISFLKRHSWSKYPIKLFLSAKFCLNLGKVLKKFLKRVNVPARTWSSVSGALKLSKMGLSLIIWLNCWISYGMEETRSLSRSLLLTFSRISEFAKLNNSLTPSVLVVTLATSGRYRFKINCIKKLHGESCSTPWDAFLSYESLTSSSSSSCCTFWSSTKSLLSRLQMLSKQEETLAWISCDFRST